MAGGMLGPKKDPKGKSNTKQLFSHEILQEHGSTAPKTENKPTIGLKGILNLGQKLELSQNKENKSWGPEFFGNHLIKEQEQLILEDQKQSRQEIEELLGEIRKLIKVTENIEKTLEIAVEQPVVEVTIYQKTFLKRVREWINQLRQDMSQAGNCIEAFSSRKKKKNAFWNNVKNKKRGGEQYLMSNEHSVARSAA